MLARAIRHSPSLPARTGLLFMSRSAASASVRRHASTFNFGPPNSLTIKVLEKQVLKLNEDKPVSADYKYRNRRHKLAHIDYCTSYMEVRALAERWGQVMPSGDLRTLFERGDEKRLASILADLNVAYRKMQTSLWTMFGVTVFASRGDVSFPERLIWFPMFMALIVSCAMQRAVLCVPRISLPIFTRWWHPRR